MYFWPPQRIKLQRIGKDIVKAQHPRAFCPLREDRHLELRDFFTPARFKAMGKRFTVLLRRFGYDAGIVFCKRTQIPHMAYKPARPVFVHKLGKFPCRSEKTVLNCQSFFGLAFLLSGTLHQAQSARRARSISGSAFSPYI